MNRQRGLSLISTMVGLVLAMIATLAMMFAYRSIVLNATSSKINGSNQAQAASGLLAAEQLIQQAGYGIVGSGGTAGAGVNQDVVLLSGASVSGGSLSGTQVTIGAAAQSGNALVWDRWDRLVTASAQCYALVLTGGGMTVYGPVSCAPQGAATYATLAWGAGTPLVQSGVLAGTPTVSAQSAQCSPFGNGPNGTSAKLVQVTLSGIGSSTPSLCLANIPN